MLGTPTDWDMVSLGNGDTLCGHPQPARLFNKPPEIAKYGKSQPRLIIHAGLNWLEARGGRRHSGGCIIAFAAVGLDVDGCHEYGAPPHLFHAHAVK